MASARCVSCVARTNTPRCIERVLTLRACRAARTTSRSGSSRAASSSSTCPVRDSAAQKRGSPDTRNAKDENLFCIALLSNSVVLMLKNCAGGSEASMHAPRGGVSAPPRAGQTIVPNYNRRAKRRAAEPSVRSQGRRRGARRQMWLARRCIRGLDAQRNR